MWAFEQSDIYGKIRILEENCARALTLTEKIHPSCNPARDVVVLDPKLHPPKKGLSSKEGQARLLHDLASIELQAMELALRTLCEFPDTDFQFRQELANLTISEGEHLKLCLAGLQDLGFQWGHWPVHCSLWQAVDESDSLLDRILIVHRYLEGSGLDAGDTLLRRLDGVPRTCAQPILKKINLEEVDHVSFGSHWYRKICLEYKIDPEEDFRTRFRKLRWHLPKRIEKINYPLRKQAGFTDGELQMCEEIRSAFLEKLV